MKRAILLAASMTVGACAHVDTGQADYRIADDPSAMTDRMMRNVVRGACGDDLSKDCDPILPSRVVRRYMPDQKAGWNAFKAPDVYSIEIEQGMIGKNILEGHVLGSQVGKTAEIAVLANVFEFASTESDAAAQRFLEAGEFSGKADDPSDVELKLVYFGDDVRRQQTFNFSNIPLRARTEYGGGSVGVQIVIMEVDAQAGPVASLLTTLARFGQQALPGPGEAKDMLFDLGESLLAGSKDDKLFEYRFVLSAASDNPRAVQATFSPGRYVLRRAQVRDNDMGWASLRLDHNTARLFRLTEHADPENKADPKTGTVIELAGKMEDYQEVRDDLYLVLNVRRYPAGTKAEYYAGKDWSTFRDALQQAADTKAAPLANVTASITTLIQKERSENWRESLWRKWAIIDDRLKLYSHRAVSDFDAVDLSGCNASTSELKRRLDVAERDARDAIRDFGREYSEAILPATTNAAGKTVGAEFDLPDREKLVSAVAAFFMPWDVSGADHALFKDASAFEMAYVSGGPSEALADAAISAARSRADSAKTCAALLLH